MSLRIIEISAPTDASEKISELAKEYNAIDCRHSDTTFWFENKKDKFETTRILINVNNQQNLMDALTRSVQKNDDWRIILIPVEATMPAPEDEDDEKNEAQKQEAKKESDKEKDQSDLTYIKHRILVWLKWFNFKDIVGGSITREELKYDMEQGSKLTFDFLLLVLLSSIVAGVGLVQSDVAIIIGAMVIAPLLGPNLALAFGAALGDRPLIFNAIKTNIFGLGFTLLVAAVAGYFIPEASVTESSELMNRTNVSYASMALALAAGGAAVLSLTTGVSSALVGVMVAVALMPPAVALGLTIGNAQWNLAFGTALLLATNVVCINLAALSIFRLKGIKPRTWYEEKQAKKASRINALIWLGMLVILAGLIWLKNYYLADGS